MINEESSKDKKILRDVLLGLLRGTQIVHSLPSYLISLHDQNESDKLFGATKLEKIVRGCTAALQAFTYYYLARKGIPAYILPTATNGVDIAAYLFNIADQNELVNSTPPKQSKVYWDTGGFWEQIFHQTYHDL